MWVVYNIAERKHLPQGLQTAPSLSIFIINSWALLLRIRGCGRKDNTLKNQKNSKLSPDERVERMNSIFDRLVLPAILFTVIILIVLGFVTDCNGCNGCTEQDADQNAQQDSNDATDVYALRELLLSDIEGNRDIFESAGYTVMSLDGADEPIAYRELSSGAQIIEGLKDSSDTTYSIIYRTDPDTGTETNLMIYGKSLFLVLVKFDGGSLSAVFYDESFTHDTSGSDSGQQEVIELVSQESLTELLSEYKKSLLSVVE